MSCAVDSLVNYETALERLLANAPVVGVETILTALAFGRTLAEAVTAPRNRPTAALSAMDGYAVRSADRERWRSGLLLVGSAYAGAPFPGELSKGQAVRIATGAQMPAQSDRVLVDEVMKVDGAAVRLVGEEGVKPHLRAIGSDFLQGEVLIPAGARLSAPALMAAAAAEARHLVVRRQPTVALVVTGDEITRPGEANSPERTPDSISVGIGALIERWGGKVVSQLYCGDEPGGLERAFRDLEAGSDITVVIGGASVGDRDRSRSAALALGARRLFEGVNLKPGKPFWAARSPRTLFVGLPGNPLAALVTARLLLAPLIAKSARECERDATRWKRRPIAQTLGAGCDRDVFLLAMRDPAGLRILANQSSSAQGGLAELEGLVRRRAHCIEAAASAQVEWLAI